MQHLSIKTLNVNQWMDAPPESHVFGDITIVEKATPLGKSGVWLEVINKDTGAKGHIHLTGDLVKMLHSALIGTEEFWKNNPTEKLS